MISSPCKKCVNVDQPKQDCIEGCNLIQDLQNIAVGEEQFACSAIDSSDDSRYELHQRHFNPGWDS